MCNGVLMVATVLTVATGDIEKGASPLCMMGGALWALSNYLVIPLVKLLGIGLGFALYHFINLVVGYGVGRLGLFGLPRLETSLPHGLLMCDIGCLILLIGFVIMIFVENDDHGGKHSTSEKRGNNSVCVDETVLGPPVRRVSSEGEELTDFRRQYRKWRLGEAKGARHTVGRFVIRAVSQRRVHSFGNFGVFGTLEEGAPETAASSPLAAAAADHHEALDFSAERGIARGRADSRNSPTLQRSLTEPLLPSYGSRIPHKKAEAKRKCLQRLVGVALALGGGGLCGVNNIPSALYALEHPDVQPYSAVFSQCLGIWLASSAIYLIYSCLAWFAGWKVPHSAIRPPYISGCIWCVGLTCMLSGIKGLGYSVGYTLDAVGPVIVSSMLSVAVYKEIQPGPQLIYFSISLLCQVVGVVLIALYGRQAH
eukprot:TRINITY_DN18494_c0_g1_i2.p1 TRINITY_DN18494_c0_g1~~TRINITY_DN18494_c0_g1_i2.p1  ORF type:complete len:425 (+),score=56.74 TRINITY_DN18494_c0_g1_i2:238-1512(+)